MTKKQFLQIINEGQISYTTEKVNVSISEGHELYGKLRSYVDFLGEKILGLTIQDIGEKSEEYYSLLSSVNITYVKFERKNNKLLDIYEMSVDPPIKLYEIYRNNDMLLDQLKPLIDSFQTIIEESVRILKTLNKID